MEGEICSEEEWEVVDYYCCNDVDDSCAKLQEEEEEEEKEKWWWWWSGVGKKVVVTGVVISSAPVVIPPLLVVSALGFVMSLPFGVVFASYAATHKLMAKLLPPPPPVHIPEDYYDEIEGGAICNAVDIKNHMDEEDEDEGFAINNAVEIQNHIQEEEEADEEVVAINNAVEIQNHIQEEEEEEDEVVAIKNAEEIQNHIHEKEEEEEEEKEEVVAINNAEEIQNHIHEKEEEDEKEEVVAINNAEEIKSLTQEEEEKMSSEEDDIKIDGNSETRIESLDNIDGPNTTVNHQQLGLHPESSSQNDNAKFDVDKTPKSSDQELGMPAEIKQLGTILMNDDDTPLQKRDESSKDAAPAKETVMIQVHHHTETVVGPTPIKTAEIDVTTVVVAADDCSLELKEEKQSRQLNGGGLHSHHEKQNISDEKIWEKINAIRVIVGFKAPKRSSYHEELKALYLYTGIEPPPPSASPSVADKLSFLMSVIGLK